MNVPAVPSITAAPGEPRETKIRHVAAQLEGLFVRQLFSAMRATVPDGGIVDGGSGEEMFTSLLDEHLADGAPAQWHGSLADSVVAQFRPRLSPPPSTGGVR